MPSFEKWQADCERMRIAMGEIPEGIKTKFSPYDFFREKRIILVNQYGLDYGNSFFFIDNFEAAKEKAISMHEENGTWVFPVTMYIYTYE